MTDDKQPTDAEIEAAREIVGVLRCFGPEFDGPVAVGVKTTLARALDALDEQEELRGVRDNLLAANERMFSRIAALEARERRVGEECEDVHRQCAQAQYDPEVASVAGFADDVLAILDGKVTP